MDLKRAFGFVLRNVFDNHNGGSEIWPKVTGYVQDVDSRMKNFQKNRRVRRKNRS